MDAKEVENSLMVSTLLANKNENFDHSISVSGEDALSNGTAIKDIKAQEHVDIGMSRSWSLSRKEGKEGDGEKLLLRIELIVMF